MSTPGHPDDLLTALRAARPDPGYQPSPASPEAHALLARVTATPHHPERANPRRPPRRLFLVGIPAIATAAAAGGVVVATRDSAGPLPEAATLRTAILDAFDQASGGILATDRSLKVPNGPRARSRPGRTRCSRGRVSRSGPG